MTSCEHLKKLRVSHLGQLFLAFVCLPMLLCLHIVLFIYFLDANIAENDVTDD